MVSRLMPMCWLPVSSVITLAWVVRMASLVTPAKPGSASTGMRSLCASVISYKLLLRSICGIDQPLFSLEGTNMGHVLRYLDDTEVFPPGVPQRVESDVDEFAFDG